jgi:hypothetical protein
MLMIQSVPSDLLYLGAELVTGKSIPVLVGITRLPVAQWLAWIMVSMGGVTGACFSALVARKTHSLSLLAFMNRLLQLGFSLGLSLSLFFSLAKGIHATRGAALAVIPAFCITVQPLPQRHSTALVSFLLCSLAFYVCSVSPTVAEPTPVEYAHRLLLPRAAAQMPPRSVAVSSYTIALTLQQIVARSIQLFALGFYAGIQHAPTELLFDTSETGVWKTQSWTTLRPVYASHHHANHTTYSLFVGLVSAWIRVCTWAMACFLQENQLHVMLENEAPGEWAWLCCTVYMTALLYSASWTATQLREQVLPRFCVFSPTDRLKTTVCIVALAILHRQEFPDVMFWLTNAFLACSVATALLTLRLSD